MVVIVHERRDRAAVGRSLLARDILRAMSDRARLVVRRSPPGGLGDNYPITLWLDDQRVARLMPGERVERDLTPGRHRLRGHNTLLAKTIELDVAAGDEAHFAVTNRAGFWTALVALLGTGPMYVTFTRQPAPALTPR